jgi:FtsH-binding integral membrane protein
MNTSQNGLLCNADSSTSQRRLWGYAAPEVSNVLIAIVVVLFIHAAGYLLSSVFSLINQNFKAFVIFLVIAVVYAVPAYGLLELRRWAQRCQLILSIFMVISGVISMFSANRAIGASAVLLHGLIAIYLLSDSCQKLFKAAKSRTKIETAV